MASLIKIFLVQEEKNEKNKYKSRRSQTSRGMVEEFDVASVGVGPSIVVGLDEVGGMVEASSAGGRSVALVDGSTASSGAPSYKKPRSSSENLLATQSSQSLNLFWKAS